MLRIRGGGQCLVGNITDVLGPVIIIVTGAGLIKLFSITLDKSLLSDEFYPRI